MRNEKGQKVIAWFALIGDEPRAAFAFAGSWQHFRSNYKGELTGFDTRAIIITEPNEVVKPIHPTHMLMIFDPTDYDVWLTG